MNIGTLAQVILDEDSLSAFRARNRNRRFKDPNSKVGFTYDGTTGDLITQLRNVIPSKQREALDKQLKGVDLKSSAYRSNDGLGAAFNPTNNVFHANRANNARTHAIKPNGQIDWNSPIMKHEGQHDKQFQIMKQIAKSRGRKRGGKLYDEYQQRWQNQYANLAKANQGDVGEIKKYSQDPMEFDANLAGHTGKNFKGLGTYRAVKSSIGLGGRKAKINPARGEALNREVVTGQKLNPEQRKELKGVYDSLVKQPNTDNNEQRSYTDEEKARMQKLASTFTDRSLTKKQRNDAMKELNSKYGLNAAKARELVGAQSQGPNEAKTHKELLNQIKDIQDNKNIPDVKAKKQIKMIEKKLADNYGLDKNGKPLYENNPKNERGYTYDPNEMPLYQNQRQQQNGKTVYKPLPNTIKKSDNTDKKVGLDNQLDQYAKSNTNNYNFTSTKTRQIDEKDLPPEIRKRIEDQEKELKQKTKLIQQMKNNNTKQPMVQKSVAQQSQSISQPQQPQPVQQFGQGSQYQPPQRIQTPYIQKYQQPQPVRQLQSYQPRQQVVQPAVQPPQQVQQPVYQQPVQQPQPVQQAAQYQPPQQVQQPVYQQPVQQPQMVQRPVQQQTNPYSINSVKPMNRQQMIKNNKFRSA